MKKTKLYIILSCLLLMIALGMIAYPLISNYLSEKNASTIRTEYFTAVAEIADADIESSREAAKKYNEILAQGVTREFSSDRLAAASTEYFSLLNLTGDGVMAYVEIPKLGLYLPVSHGTEAETLESGIGHVIGSSLPIGGESSHAVLSGHSGLASQKMFSDLTELEIGDDFYIHVLNEVLAYQVDEINSVLPTDTSLLKIEHDRDLVTLVTCTPIGVNTHRLLVRGSRVPYIPAATEAASDVSALAVSSAWETEYLHGILMGLLVLSLCAAGYAGYLLYRRYRHG